MHYRSRGWKSSSVCACPGTAEGAGLRGVRRIRNNLFSVAGRFQIKKNLVS